MQNQDYHTNPVPEYQIMGASRVIHQDELTAWGVNINQLDTMLVKDDSMSPRLQFGNEVLINTTNTTITNGKVYAIRYRNELIIKRLKIRNDKALIIKSDNPASEYKQKIIAESERHQIQIVGQVIRLLDAKV